MAQDIFSSNRITGKKLKLFTTEGLSAFGITNKVFGRSVLEEERSLTSEQDHQRKLMSSLRSLLAAEGVSLGDDTEEVSLPLPSISFNYSYLLRFCSLLSIALYLWLPLQQSGGGSESGSSGGSLIREGEEDDTSISISADSPRKISLSDSGTLPFIADEYVVKARVLSATATATPHSTSCLFFFLVFLVTI